MGTNRKSALSDRVSCLSYFSKTRKNNFFCNQNQLYLHGKLEHYLIIKKLL